MPRNSSGTYALPSGNPVVANTLIETSWANPTMSDVGTALTDSLDRNGRGAMLAALKIAAGLVSAPGLSFSSETTSGVYRAGANIIGMAIAGVERQRWTSTGVSVTGDLALTGAFSSGATTLASLIVSGAAALNGGVTLGDAAGDAFTINSSAVSVPNGLNFDANTFVIDATNNRVAIGTASFGAGASIKLTLLGASGGGLELCDPTTGGAAFIPSNGGGLQIYTFTGAVGSEAYTQRVGIDSSGNVTPGANNAQTLGSAALNWSNVHANIHSVAGIQALSTSGGVLRIGNAAWAATTLYGGTTPVIDLVGTAATPATNNTITLGSASFQWSDVRSVLGSFSGNVTAGNSVAKGRLFANTNASASTTPGTNPVLWVGGGNANVSTISELGFTYGTASGVDPGTFAPVTVGYQLTSGAGNTRGDLVICTRSVTTDTAPTEKLRIDGTGNTTPGTNNAQTLGSAALQWSDVRSVLGTFTGQIAASFTGTALLVSASNAGGLEDIRIINGSNSASSDAAVRIQVAGTSAGDAYGTYTIAGGQTWAVGLDNSDSDALVFSSSSSLGSSNVLRINTAGDITIPLGNVDITRSAAGAPVTVLISNTSNTASADATVFTRVAGASAGDAYTKYTVAGVTDWSVGVDNSDSDAYVISSSGALGTSNALRISTAGVTSVTLGNFDVGRTAAGSAVASQVLNLSTAASSDAAFAASVAGTAAGDPFSVYSVSGGSTWSFGVDNSNNDVFTISAAATLGTNNALAIAVDGTFLFTANSATQPVITANNSNAAPVGGVIVNYSGADPNSTGVPFFRGFGTATLRAEIRSNGGLANFSANNVNLSDARLKTDVRPAQSYWDKFKALELVTYKYIDQTDDEPNLGLIAQQVDVVAPELVSHAGYGGDNYLAIYQTDFQFATAKALQEAMLRIETLEQHIATLH